MIGVILAILHIMIAIYVAFRVFKQLYYMFENIKEKDMRSAAFNVLVFAILAPLYYYCFFVWVDVREAVGEIINYFS